jgi:hypothetical protein
MQWKSNYFDSKQNVNPASDAGVVSEKPIGETDRD